MPSTHATKDNGGVTWYKSLGETELLTAGLFPLVPCPDLGTVLHVPCRHRAAELNPFHTNWYASFPDVLAILASLPGHQWHQLWP